LLKDHLGLYPGGLFSLSAIRDDSYLFYIENKSLTKKKFFFRVYPLLNCIYSIQQEHIDVSEKIFESNLLLLIYNIDQKTYKII